MVSGQTAIAEPRVEGPDEMREMPVGRKRLFEATRLAGVDAGPVHARRDRLEVYRMNASLDVLVEEYHTLSRYNKGGTDERGG